MIKRAIFNEFLRRLHGYDEVARVTMIKQAQLENELRALKEKDKKENKEEKNTD